MRWIIEGYGSIGSRHYALLKELGQDVRLVSGRSDTPCKTYNDPVKAIEYFKPDYYLICNSTNRHMPSLARLIDIGFDGICALEKPTGLNCAECERQPPFQTIITFNMRFHPIVERMRDELGNEDIIAARLSVGQYLPDWRPGRDYSKVYSAIRAQGGGVLRDLSHELDLAQYFCGNSLRLTAMADKYSNLEIDTEDWVTALLEMTKCPTVSIHMDYLDRNAHRDFTILTNSRTISADLWHNKLTINGETRVFNIERNDSFRKQLESLLHKDFSSLCSYADGQNVMKMIDAIEKAAKEKIWVDMR